MCIGAWSLYHAQGEDVEAKCDAVPAFVFGEDYIHNWSTWNGYELDDQIVDGINALYAQCSDVTGAELAELNQLYCDIATKFTGKSKDFESTDEYAHAECSSAAERTV